MSDYVTKHITNINNKVNLNSYIVRNFHINVRRRILEILFNFGPQTKSELFAFFQISEKIKSERLDKEISFLLSKKLIKKNGNKFSLFLSSNQLNETLFDTENFQKALLFLRYLLQLRDNEGKFLYYGDNGITSAKKYFDNDSFRELEITILKMKVDILFCPGDLIYEYNDLLMDKGFSEKKHILLSDDYLDINEITSSSGLLYVVSITDNNEVRFLK